MRQYDESLPRVQVDDRVTLRILDSEGQGVSNAFLSISVDGAGIPLIETYARSDGIFYFFPTLDGAESATEFSVEVRSPDPESTPIEVKMNLDELGEDRIFDIILEGYISALPDSLDLMLVIDTTGSMSDELDYITQEFEDIIGMVEDMYPEVHMRFGLVVYRDDGDAYVVRSYEFTDSLTKMQQQLDDQRAGGGGDYPEAMDQALASAVEFQWRGGNCAR
ncbi:MAG: VWA domain-containing protein, partial [Thermoplasmata archaeon]|nr:VWA domain-containing protein [Thermoplasmata archaeon]